MKKIFLISLICVGCRKTIDTPYPISPITPATVGTLNVSPNPSNGMVTINLFLDATTKYNLQVTDLNGKSIKSMAVSSSQIQQNFSSLENGTYDLILIDISGNQTKTPLIIKK
jgi:hypothetical protein